VLSAGLPDAPGPGRRRRAGRHLPRARRSGSLRLLSLIWSQPGAEACVCHLVEPIGLSQPTVSHHLKLLNDAGLLAREKRGAWVYYRVVASRLEAVRAALAPHAREHGGPNGREEGTPPSKGLDR